MIYEEIIRNEVNLLRYCRSGINQYKSIEKIEDLPMEMANRKISIQSILLQNKLIKGVECKDREYKCMRNTEHPLI